MAAWAYLCCCAVLARFAYPARYVSCSALRAPNIYTHSPINLPRQSNQQTLLN